MLREDGFNPVPVLVHVVGIAIGIFLGLLAMAALAPDLPGEAEVSELTAQVPPDVAADAADSLRPENLAPALDQLETEIGDGDTIVRLRIEPGELSAETGEGEGLLALGDVSPALPQTIVDEITAERSRVTLEEIGYMELVATADGPRWYVQLDIGETDVPPPWTYGAPLAGSPIEIGGPPPVPVG